MRNLINSAVLIFAFLSLAGATHAHSALLSSKPAAEESVATSPERVQLVFSVRVQHEISSISLIGPDGEVQTPGPLEATPDGKTVWVELAFHLPPGRYKVEWRALSADDHTIKGDFAFSVLPPAARSSFADPPEPTPPDQDHSMMDHSSHIRQVGISWPESIARWFAYLGMLVFGGGLAFRLFVAAPSAGTGSELAAFDNAAIKGTVAAAGVFLAAACVALALQTVALFDVFSFTGAMAVIRDTTFGAPWAAQVAAAVVGIVFLLIASYTDEASRRKWFWAAFATSLVLFVASGFTGHARAASAEYALAAPSDWLHLAAASVWVGGLVMIFTAVPRAVAVIDREAKPVVYSEYISRFNKLAIVSVLVLAATGIYNSWIHVESIAALFRTTYGQLLIAKVILSMLMVVVGGLNAYVIHPRIRASADGAENILLRNVKLEVALAAVVLLIAALLAFLPPAREHLPVSAAQSRPAVRSLV